LSGPLGREILTLKRWCSRFTAVPGRRPETLRRPMPWPMWPRRSGVLVRRPLRLTMSKYVIWMYFLGRLDAPCHGAGKMNKPVRVHMAGRQNAACFHRPECC
jgi:hypothetical protein